MWLFPQDSPVLNLMGGGFVSARPDPSPVPGGIAVLNDQLTVGPTPPIRDISRWLNRRADWWDTVFDDPEQPAAQNFPIVRSKAGVGGAELIRLWCGTGSGDWLAAALWTHLLVREAWAKGRMELVTVDLVTWDDGRTHVPVSMGEVSELNAAKHLPGEPLAPDSIAKLLAAWKAATAATPEPAAAFASGAGRWPLLRRAVGFLLDRLPSAETGLPVWDERLLRAVVGGERRVPRLIGEMLRVRDRTGDDPGDL